MRMTDTFHLGSMSAVLLVNLEERGGVLTSSVWHAWYSDLVRVGKRSVGVSLLQVDRT